MRKLTATTTAILLAIVTLSACATTTGGTSAERTTTVLGASPAGHVPAQRKPRPADAAQVRKPAPRPAPKPKNFCAGNTAAHKVIVSLGKQHAWMCARRTAVFDTAITTGMQGEWTSTPTGDYWIQGRTTNTVLTLNTGAQYAVQYWIPFDAPLFGFHDSSWQDFPYGSGKYKTEGSHGCIHMPLRAMKFLYRWAEQQTSVHIST